MCGGTSQALIRARARIGLSPRVRGNHFTTIQPCGCMGSIPACAGEPLPPLTQPKMIGVYPRVCGGTTYRVVSLLYQKGLSPRVRGNLGVIGPRRGARQVYPRVCGGTRIVTRHEPSSKGLSPRVRGNREIIGGLSVGQRSIPACAGEPARWTAARLSTRVYPRVCGGTHMLA